MVSMKQNNNLIAHTDVSGNTHDLREHLEGTAKLAQKHAEVFGYGAWAYQAALWHDLGKYSSAFQKKLAGYPDKKVDHSTAGAQYAYQETLEPYGTILAWIIAGHHAGLADWSSGEGGSQP